MLLFHKLFCKVQSVVLHVFHILQKVSCYSFLVVALKFSLCLLMCSLVLLFQLSDPSAGIVFFSLVLAEQCDFSMGKALVSVLFLFCV